MKTTAVKAAILFLAVTLGGCTAAGGGENVSPILRLTRTIRLPGVGVPEKTADSAAVPGRLDHCAYDGATGRLFISGLQQGSLEVVDLNTGERIKRIMGLKKPQGIAVVASAGCVVVGCGDENAVHVYSLADLSERAVTAVGQNADNVRTDGTNLVYIGFGPDTGTGGVAVYDAAALKKVGEISLASRPESFQFDLRPGHSEFFVNLPGQKRADHDGSVGLADRVSGRTLGMWHLDGAAQNFPMAFDSVHERVFIAGRKPAQVMCLDSNTGAIISRAPCVADSDDLYYDAQTNRVLVIGGGHRTGEPAPAGAEAPGADAALDVFEVSGVGGMAKIASVATSPHARTGFFVPERRAVYIVCPPSGGEDAKVMEFSIMG